MLVLSRRVNEQLVIGNDVVITVQRISGNRITLGIEAPRQVRIRRGSSIANPTKILKPMRQIHPRNGLLSFQPPRQVISLPKKLMWRLRVVPSLDSTWRVDLSRDMAASLGIPQDG